MRSPLAFGVRPFLLLLLLIGILLTPAEARTALGSADSSCDPGFLECDEGKTCVPDHKICDTKPDCDDGQDENEFTCFCRMIRSKPCRQKSDCYAQEDECDGVDDCGDGTDEENCPSLPEVNTASPLINGRQSLTTSRSTSPFFYNFSPSNSSSSGPFTNQIQIIKEAHLPGNTRVNSSMDKPEIPQRTVLPVFRNKILTVVVESPTEEYEIEHSTNGSSNGLICHEAGTKNSLDWRTLVHCPCKKHVTGRLCDECKEKTFHLDEKNKHGCLQCFCMNKSKVCNSSSLYRMKLRKKKIRCGSNLNPKSFNGRKEEADSELTECQLPPEFLGDKISSYGGVFKMRLRGVNQNATLDLFIRGYGVVLRRSDEPRKGKERSKKRSRKERSVRVKLLEKNWRVVVSKSRSRRATREELLTALAAIESFTVRMRRAATSSRRITLRRVSLEVATSNHSTSKDQALEVEECECPEGYTGTSCQTCSQGYRKVQVKYGPPEYIRFVCRKETTIFNLRKIRRKKFCLEFYPGTSLPISITKIYNSYCVTSVKESSP